MKTNIVIDISLIYLGKFWFLTYGPKCSQPIKLQDSLKCNVVREKWVMKFIFCMQISTKVFYKMILSLWVCVSRQVQSTKNSQFTISLQYKMMKLIFCLLINVEGFFTLMHHFRCVWSDMPKILEQQVFSVTFLCR